MTSTIAAATTTPIFDAMIAKHGDPVMRPAVDRSLAKLTKLAEEKRRAGAKTSKLSAARSKVSPIAKSDQDKDE